MMMHAAVSSASPEYIKDLLTLTREILGCFHFQSVVAGDYAFQNLSQNLGVMLSMSRTNGVERARHDTFSVLGTMEWNVLGMMRSLSWDQCSGMHWA